jgi:hypothetical protein
MRPRSIRALAALLTAACGSSPESSLFGGGAGNQPVIGVEAGTDPEPGSGGKTATSGGSRATGGGPAHSAGGIAGAAPKAGGGPGRGGTPPNDAGGAAGKATPGDAGDSGGSADMGGAGGTAGDGAGGQVPDAGGQTPGTGGSTAGATPHSVACGATSCQVGSALSSACCVSPVPLATVCIPTLGAGCANAGAAVTCDDAADCMPGEICCRDSVASFPITVCAKDCKDGLDQLCRTDAECKRGGSCEPMDAQPQYSRCK